MEPSPGRSLALHRSIGPWRLGVRGVVALFVAGFLLSGCSLGGYCAPCPNPQPESYRRIAKSFVRQLGIRETEVTLERSEGEFCTCPYARARDGYIDDAPEVFIQRAIEKARARGFKLISQRPDPLVPGESEYWAALERGDTGVVFSWDVYADARVGVAERPYGGKE